jgi:hypothetical protein
MNVRSRSLPHDSDGFGHISRFVSEEVRACRQILHRNLDHVRSRRQSFILKDGQYDFSLRVKESE